MSNENESRVETNKEAKVKEIDFKLPEVGELGWTWVSLTSPFIHLLLSEVLFFFFNHALGFCVNNLYLQFRLEISIFIGLCSG